jgi:transcriptional regulator with XRE-family HTH domain
MPRSTSKKAPARPTTVKSPTDIDREIGKRIRALREQTGISQTALGEGSGITFQHCDLLGVPASQIVEGLSPARQPKADPLQPLRTGHGVRLAKAWERLDSTTQAAMLKLIEQTAGR